VAVRPTSVKARYLDASALVKLLVDEGDCAPLRAFCNGEPNVRTTALCVAEALGVFKRKWLRKELTLEQYLQPHGAHQGERIAARHGVRLDAVVEPDLAASKKSSKWMLVGRGASSFAITVSASWRSCNSWRRYRHRRPEDRTDGTAKVASELTVSERTKRLHPNTRLVR
jgi:uncharacterized protein with PIN domain